MAPSLAPDEFDATGVVVDGSDRARTHATERIPLRRV